jgi:hypothetical protein
MSKSIILTFNSTPIINDSDNITIKIDNGTNVLDFTETFKNSRNSSFEVSIPNPYNNNQQAQNFANAWNLDYRVQDLGGGRGDIFATSFQNTVTIFVNDNSWSFPNPIGSAIDSGSITFNAPATNSVTINSYSENATNPCSFVDVEIGITGGVSPYDIYTNGDLVLSNQTSPVTLELIRGLFYDVEVLDDNGDLIGNNFTNSATPINVNDISILLSEDDPNTLVEIQVDNTNSLLTPFTYSLDGVNYQVSAFFANIPDGTYTAYVKDSLGCVKSKAFTIGDGLVYFTDYKDVVDVQHRIEIIKAGYVGTPVEFNGYAVLEYPEEKDLQEPIKPCGLSLNLLASNTLSFDDLYSEEERTFRVVYTRNDVTLFNGWLSSDGLYQSFVDDKWYLELSAIDGFGFLEDLAYVENNTGLNFIGKQTALDIILNCLKRTNLTHNVRTSVNIYYTGLSDVNVLDNVYFNSERFIKDDDNTTMDCEEVLKSILEIFNASIIYFEGYWYIYRSNEIFDNSTITYYEYDLDKTFIEQNVKHLNFNVGNVVDGFYPHHINANQKRSLERSLGAYRVNLKWGKVFPYYDNQSFIWNDSTSLDEWTIDTISGGNNFVEPFDNLRGLRITDANDPIRVMYSDDFTVNANPKIQFQVTYSNLNDVKPTLGTGGAVFNCKIVYTKGANTYYLTRDGFWTTTDTLIQYGIAVGEQNFTLTVNSEVVPENDGIIRIDIFDAGFDLARFPIHVSKMTMQTFRGESEPQGRNYTVEKTSNYTPKTNDDIKKVFNGDIEDGTYYGTIYKNDEITETTTWNRQGIVEEKEILRIMAEDRMRMNYAPKQIFEGDFYGYVPYFCILAINNIDSKFLPISYSYDTKNNIVSVMSKELLNTNFDTDSVIYSSSLDYGNVVKPTIKG